MAKRKQGWALRAELYPVQAVFKILGFLPPAVARRFSRVVMRSLLQALPKRTRLIDDQMRACFPEKSVAEREALARRSIVHLADGLAAFARIPQMSAADYQAKVEPRGFEHLEAALALGRGAITFTAHYGFWELMAVHVTRLYPNVSMLVRPIENPLIDKLVTRVRGSGGGGVIDSAKVFKDGVQLLRKNGVLGILVDQNFYKGGVFVDFFGRPAATSTLVPLLARRTGCAVLPMHNVWVGDGIRTLCEPPIQLSDNPVLSAAVAEDTQQITKIVERWIREDPAQWLWLHNRWKRQPKPEELLAKNVF